MAIVEKSNGSLRLCIDPRALNEALQRKHFKLPTFDDVLPTFNKAKIFTKQDTKEAFWHIKLDKESSKLTTMITPYGRFRWTRLPFGLNVSSAIFQRHLTQALEGLEGCINVTIEVRPKKKQREIMRKKPQNAEREMQRQGHQTEPQ